MGLHSEIDIVHIANEFPYDFLPQYKQGTYKGTHLMETSYGKIALPEAPILLKVLKGGLNWLGTFVVSTADRTNVLCNTCNIYTCSSDVMIIYLIQ